MKSAHHVGPQGRALRLAERLVNGPMIGLKGGVAPQVDITRLHGLLALALTLNF